MFGSSGLGRTLCKGICVSSFVGLPTLMAIVLGARRLHGRPVLLFPYQRRRRPPTDGFPPPSLVHVPIPASRLSTPDSQPTVRSSPQFSLWYPRLFHPPAVARGLLRCDDAVVACALFHPQRARPASTLTAFELDNTNARYVTTQIGVLSVVLTIRFCRSPLSRNLQAAVLRGAARFCQFRKVRTIAPDASSRTS